MPTKACSRCGEVKPLEAFKKEKRAPSGFAAHCKMCHSSAQKALNKHRRVVGPSIIKACKMCPVCKVEKQSDAFYINRTSADWLSQACRDCTKRRHKLFYQNNKERFAIWAKVWIANNKEHVNAYYRQRRREKEVVREQQREGRRRWRARKQNAPINDLTEKQWVELLQYNGQSCAYCGSVHDLSQDHAVPLSLGGDHTLVNIVPACRSCNSRKHTKTLLEFVWESAA